MLCCLASYHRSSYRLSRSAREAEAEAEGPRPLVRSPHHQPDTPLLKRSATTTAVVLLPALHPLRLPLRRLPINQLPLRLPPIHHLLQESESKHLALRKAPSPRRRRPRRLNRRRLDAGLKPR